MDSEQVLVIGAGIAGMEASLMLAKAGKKVFLVERQSLIGGNTIKNEESFPNLECSTCMVAPIQQDILQHPNIETMTLSMVEKIEGEVGNFSVTILKKARYVSLTACIGCAACYEPCPVILKNEWEANLSEKKAIYVPCAGALPNVPMIDPEKCTQLNGKKKCQACAEACMFEAIDLSQKDERIEKTVGAIIVATGFDLFDVSKKENLGYGKYPGVYTSMEFERLFASNGPTEGELTLRDGKKTPGSVAIIHCIGRKEQGYCSGVCCMYSFKHAHFIKHKLPETKVTNIHSDICVPGKGYEKFFKNIENKETDLVFTPSFEDIEVSGNGSGLVVKYLDTKNKKSSLKVDMVILAVAMTPHRDTAQLNKMVSIDQDQWGFFQTLNSQPGSVETSRPGVYVAGAAEGPKDIQSSVLEAESAAGKIMALFESIQQDFKCKINI
jgi:heterodisulfide reductase subunit A